MVSMSINLAISMFEGRLSKYCAVRAKLGILSRTRTGQDELWNQNP